MGEIKGQLLSVLLALVVFGAIGSALYTAFVSTKDKVVNKITEAETTIKKPAINIELLSFKN